MKFLSYKTSGHASWGALDPAGKVIDCRETSGFATLHEAIAAGALPGLARQAAGLGGALPLAQAELLPPLPNPGKIICIGLNYVDHAAESPYKDVPTYPVMFIRHANSLVAHGAPLVRPRVSQQLDYEGELLVVIGKRGRHVSKERALEHVCGYSVFNDATIRDYQFKSHQWYIGKNFDGTGGFGPFIVTPEGLPPGARGLRIQTRLNGQVMQDASTADMVFDVATLIETITEGITLEPGDLIVSGTPAGIGMARKPPVWMKAGDVCEVEIEGIGTLNNPIADEPAR